MVVPTDLGTASTALLKSVEARPEDFIPTKAEWSADGNRELIYRSLNNSSSVGASVLFTVPKGKTLFITSAYVSGSTLPTTTASFGSSWVAINIDGSSVPILEVTLPRTNSGVANNDSLAGSSSLSYPMPIKANENQQIRLQSNGNLRKAGGFQGYLE